MNFETKVVRLPAALAERLSALSVLERAAIVEKGFSVSSVVEPAPHEGPAFAAPAVAVVEAPAQPSEIDERSFPSAPLPTLPVARVAVRAGVPSEWMLFGVYLPKWGVRRLDVFQAKLVEEWRKGREARSE